MKIALIVFSGTGNTLYVSQLLADELIQLGKRVDVITLGVTRKELENIEHFKSTIEAYEMIGFAFPVLGFAAPINVLAFAEALPSLKDKKVFIFKSASDNHDMNNAASEDLAQILKSKGYDVFHDYLYVMPCNFIVSYPKIFNLQMIDRAKQKAFVHARELVLGVRAKLSLSPFWHIIARSIHYLENNYGRKSFGKALHTTSKCEMCLRCLENCPAGNITLQDERLIFQDKCLFCMRCIYNCPAHAIEAKMYNWCVIAQGYNLKEYLVSSETKRVFLTPRSKGFWKHFRCYFYN